MTCLFEIAVHCSYRDTEDGQFVAREISGYEFVTYLTPTLSLERRGNFWEGEGVLMGLIRIAKLWITMINLLRLTSL